MFPALQAQGMLQGLSIYHLESVPLTFLNIVRGK